MIYLYQDGTPTDEAIGTVAFLDKGDTQINQKSFNHWDELVRGMRKLLSEAGYIKRTDKDGWIFEKR